MPSGATPGWDDLRVGLAVLICLVPLAAGVFWLDALRRVLVEGPELVVVADEIHGLEPGSEVWVAGSPAGRVTRVSFIDTHGGEPGRVAVRIVLRREATLVVRSDAEARIGSRALLAPPVVKLTPGSPDAPPYDFSDTLAVSTLPGLEDFRALADSGRTALARLQEDVGALGREMETGSGTLPRLRRQPELLAELDRQHLRYRDLRQAWGEDGLGAAWRDTSLHAQAAGVGERLRGLVGELTTEDRARPGERLPAAVEALRSRATRLAGRLEAADGTLGRLANDDELRLQAERTRSLLDSLLVESTTHPLRFLHFRLF